jgi:glutathione S-transferase
VPVIDDDGFIVAESAAVLLYLAEKADKLVPSDFEGRMRVVQ